MLVVGQIVRPHGIHGEVIVYVRTDEPELRFAAGSVLVTDPAAAGPLTVGQARPHASAGPGRLIVSFDGVYDRSTADDLRGTLLSVDSAEIAPSDDPDEFNDHQLVGLSAVTPDGEALGDVTRIEHAPASDLLVLHRPDGRTALVPFVKAIVPEVDLPGRRVVVTPPPGLFDL
ncbi:MAG TPA: ribosome maturation factor RimM [Micromonosporaceae bacterium]|nr:ribosome maturation factor RimM [Micromonosporaceae bacterium]